MKNLIYLILFSLSVYASQQGDNFLIEKKIMIKIAHAVVPDKRVIKICLQDTKFPVSIYKENFTIVQDCKMADLIILGNNNNQNYSNKDKPIIVLDYNLLKRYPEAIGAFYWQKGRPNIVMIAPRIKKIGIKLPFEFKRYVESRVW